MNNIWLALITGLTTGGISCLAVQGGLLTSSIANQKGADEAKSGNFRFVAYFLISKLVAYTILGFLLGLLGSFIILSLKTQAIFQILIGIFLIGTAGYILELHPIFRYFAIRPPKFALRIARNNSKNVNSVTPFILGALTVLMPCGVTQAMMAVALGTGNPIYASGIMFAFVLGTSPVFFMLGVATLNLLKRKAFRFVAAGALVIFGIISINGAMGMLGSPHTLQNYWKVVSKNTTKNEAIAGVSANGTQDVTINVTSRGYQSNVSTLKAGVPVKLKLVTNNTLGCSRAFSIPSLNVSKLLPQTGSEVIEFTPTKTGRLAYTCSMGMYTGSFTVVN